MVPNVVTYSALVSACEKGEQPQRALELFNAMKQQGVLPNGIAYNALVCACKKGQEPNMVLKVFNSMQRQGVVPNAVTCAALHLLLHLARQKVLLNSWSKIPALPTPSSCVCKHVGGGSRVVDCRFSMGGWGGAYRVEMSGVTGGMGYMNHVLDSFMIPF